MFPAAFPDLVSGHLRSPLPPLTPTPHFHRTSASGLGDFSMSVLVGIAESSGSFSEEKGAAEAGAAGRQWREDQLGQEAETA